MDVVPGRLAVGQIRNTGEDGKLGIVIIEISSLLRSYKLVGHFCGAEQRHFFFDELN